MQISQTDNYGEPNFYRPVIKNPSAISYKIDYVIRLYNRNDNSQIWKKSSMISQSPAKFGRKLLQLNIGANPIQSTIFNKNIVKEVQINRIIEPVLDNTKYITSFLDNTLVSVSYESINPGGDEIQFNTIPSINKAYKSSVSGTIYANGLARILISDSECFLKFVVYQKDQKSGKDVAMNLSGIGELILSFVSDTNENLDILEFPSTYTSKSNGEIVFRLTHPQSQQVLAFTNRQFRLFLKNPKGETTFLYNGKWYNQTEWMNIAEANQVAKLEAELSKMTSINTQLQGQLKIQSDTITKLNATIAALNKQLVDYVSADTAEDAQFQNAINGLKLQVTSQQSTIDSLNQQIKDLNASLSLAQSQVLSEAGMISALQAQLANQSIVLGATSIALVKDDSVPVKPQTGLIKTLEPVKANINTTPATTYTMPGGGGGCFVAGTKVIVASGEEMNIEDIFEGISLLTYNTETGKFEGGVVKKLIRPVKDNIIKVRLKDGKLIQSTEEHPYFVKDKGWCSFAPHLSAELHDIEVSQLEPGDFVMDSTGKWIEIKTIVPEVLAEMQTVYNFEIQGNHTYFANGILVHNKMAPNYGGGTYTNVSGFSGYGWQ
jgi:uncharacterized coiled-coil protein SlyX/uncharacterized protein YwbE